MPEKPRTFPHFPVSDICPVCGTNDDQECVLLVIDHTQDGNIAEAAPVHLWCAVAERITNDKKIIYKKMESQNGLR